MSEVSSAAAEAPSGPPELNTADHAKPATLDSTKEILGREDDTPYVSGDLLHKPVFAHASGGPTAGLLDKIKELQQRWKDTPGATYKGRFDRWFEERASEYAADTGVTWPSATWTKLWKFFFKANRGTTDRYGFAIKMGAMDQRSEADRAAARERSAASLVNIDPQERTRRAVVGLSLVAVAVAAGIMLVGTKQGLKPPLDETEATTIAGSLLGGSLLRLSDDAVRFIIKASVLPPFAFGALLAVSGAFGLWSIAIASIWDVDGTGMQQVPTAELDLALRKKVVYTFSVAQLVVMIIGLAWLVLA